ncbi:hypothetical protein QBC44DRAFT_335285 [Cladorrhinum sp. PSN332]|nr:hypothetical protein QBC44DRAFT_335285 [Cladorrhinum sp. PSN332]
MSAAGDQLIELVNDWVRSDINRIAQAYLQQGGWEGWAQVELALYLRAHAHERFKTLYEVMQVHREAYVYADSNNRADIVLSLPGGEQFIIELKCESWGNQKKFGTNMLEDYIKVSDAQLKYVYKSAVRYAVGISVSSDGIEYVLKKSGLDGKVQGDFKHPIMGEEIHDVGWAGAVVWWYRSE